MAIILFIGTAEISGLLPGKSATSPTVGQRC